MADFHRSPDIETALPLTLWKMLRRHGVGLYAAQMICNDVMLNGVSLPSDAPAQSSAGSARAPTAWMHEITEPGGHTNRLYSDRPDNPWSHWLESHREQCAYKATPLYDGAAQPSADTERPVEVWNGDRKVTVYDDIVLRVWGPDMENEMSEAPRSHESVGEAFRWLFPDPAQPSGERLYTLAEAIEALKGAIKELGTSPISSKGILAQPSPHQPCANFPGCHCTESCIDGWSLPRPELGGEAK